MRSKGASELVGTVIGSRYRIDKVLGEGGMGAVYRAEHTLMRKKLAVKVLHPEMSRLPEVVARFEREAMAAAHIEHPNVAAATDFGKLDDGSFFLVLEFIEGDSLRDVIAQGPLDTGRALRIVRQIASALQRAHALGIVHRDLKPENVMLIERDGEKDFVKVLDFGIAKVPVGELMDSAAKDGSVQPALTQLGMVYGTPEYMAPEQALGQAVDPRADLYALGVMMFEMLAGVRPYEHESKVSLLGMHVTAPIPRVTDKAPTVVVPGEVESILERLLAKNADDRIQDAKTLCDAIDGNWSPGYGDIPASEVSQRNAVGTMLGVGGRASQSGSPLLLTPSGSVSGPLPILPGSSGAWQVRVREHWKLVAAIAGAGVIAIVIAIVALVGGAKANTTTTTEADGAATASSGQEDIEVYAPPGDQEAIKNAVSLVDNGDYGSGVSQLSDLAKRYPKNKDIHRALVRGYMKRGDKLAAMKHAGELFELDAKAADEKEIYVAVRDAALDETSAPIAFELLESKMGTLGPDILYDIAYGLSGEHYPAARKRAQQSLATSEAQQARSAALAVALELRKAKTCPAKKALLERATEHGDARALPELEKLTSRRGCGFARARDCWPCLRKGHALDKAIVAIKKRASK